MNVYFETYCSFSHDIKEYVQPFRQESFTSFCQVQTTDTPKLNAQTLEKDSKEIGHQDNEEKPESVSRSSSNVCSIVSVTC